MNLLERLGHHLTGWRHFAVPDAEHVEVARDRSVVTSSVDAGWPAHFADLRTGRRSLGRVNLQGETSGTPMQAGGSQIAALKVGIPGVHDVVTVRCPRPVLGFWWTTNWPTPSADKHASIVTPDGDVFEFIQLDPTPILRLPWTTDANTYGIWHDGKLIQGKANTASGLPRHRFLWTPFSASDPHVCSIVLPDYQGSDGLLAEGPVCGQRVVLDPASESFRAMFDLGGECQAIALALVEFGAVIIDRSGYADVPAAAKKVGAKPHAPSLSIQAGAQWAATNIDQLSLRLGDFRAAL